MAITKKTTKKVTPFSSELMEFIKEGQTARKKFLDLSEDLKKISPKDKFPHHYIYSQAGLGKSYTVKSTFEKAGITNYNIFNGSISMNGLINQLAVIVRNLKKNEFHYIYLEDCTNLFRREEDLNILKNYYVYLLRHFQIYYNLNLIFVTFFSYYHNFLQCNLNLIFLITDA
jgi:hypothetical protein